MSMVDTVRDIVAPVLADLGLDLYDLEYNGGVIRVLVDRDGGADLESIATATRIISRELDHADPLPGRYTLEVSSPGLERPLRTPDHFRRIVGWKVSVRMLPHVEGERRVQGVLQSADDEGVTVLVDEGPDPGERHVRHADIERAKTVFEWGAGPKPGSPNAPRSGAGSASKDRAGAAPRKKAAS